MAIKLNDEERVWVHKKWRAIRESQKEADKANNDWKQINDALNARLDASGVKDIVARSASKSASIPLADALATGNWHARNAERNIQDVTLFLRLRELGVM